MDKEWLVSNFNLIVNNMYNSYLPVSRRGRNHGERCRGKAKVLKKTWIKNG